MDYRFEYVRQMFAAQFEADGDEFVYRYSQKGPAIRVSAAEREAFIKQFARSLWIMMGVLVLAMLVWLGGLFAYIFQERDPPESLMYLGLVGVVAVGLPVSYWGWGAPARALKSRTPVARARSSEEYRRYYLGKMGYGQLAAGGLCGAAIPFMMSRDVDVFAGWGRVWLFVGAVLIVGCLVQAFRKWRIERGGS